jgi:bifunctional non-homologous end joining protein LigD
MKVSNADRVVFPDDGVTKGEVVAYYESVAGHMLPFLAGRALTVERYPRGIGAKGFMQKNAPEHFTDEIDRHEVPKEDGGTTVYPVVRDAGAIAAFANLGVITFHVPPSTVADEWHPDWVIWDLDPPSGAFGLVRDAATHLREVLRSFGVETLLMTSGSNGYHLRARLDPVADAEMVAKAARGVSALAAAAYPDEMTLAFRKADRGDRVFVDWLRNAPYSTSVVPWSLRGRPGAPVAVPLRPPARFRSSKRHFPNRLSKILLIFQWLRKHRGIRLRSRLLTSRRQNLSLKLKQNHCPRQLKHRPYLFSQNRSTSTVKRQ